MSVDLRQHESKPNTDTQFSSVWFSFYQSWAEPPSSCCCIMLMLFVARWMCLTPWHSRHSIPSFLPSLHLNWRIIDCTSGVYHSGNSVRWWSESSPAIDQQAHGVLTIKLANILHRRIVIGKSAFPTIRHFY